MPFMEAVLSSTWESGLECEGQLVREWALGYMNTRSLVPCLNENGS